jgi:hypothetical protein
VTTDGQDSTIQVEITNATPSGDISWEEDAWDWSSGPPSGSCLINYPPWQNNCGQDLNSGMVTANNNGAATFDVTFIPGEVYSALNFSSADDFSNNVHWEVDVWDDSTYKEGGLRGEGLDLGVTVAANAPPPSEWSQS